MPKSNVVELAGVVDISKAESLMETLKKTADKGGPIEIDVSKVSRIDTAGLQLLLSFQNTLNNEQHGKVAVTNPSEEFVQCAKLIGLDAAFTN